MQSYVKAMMARLTALTLLGWGGTAVADIQVMATRIIYNAQDPFASVNLANNGDQPYVVQAWLEPGDGPIGSLDPKQIPIIAIPPIFRIDPHKESSVRLQYAGGKALPTDRETQFWIDLQEIPPKPSGPGANSSSLQIAVRNRLKVFYRPVDLKGDPALAAQQMQWFVAELDGHTVLKVHNPSEYHVTFGAIQILDRKHHLSALDDTVRMIAPGATLSIPLSPGMAAAGEPSQIDFEFVTDFGGSRAVKSPLLPNPADAATAEAPSTGTDPASAAH
jgi:chaperone protein EcpD